MLATVTNLTGLALLALAALRIAAPISYRGGHEEGAVGLPQSFRSAKHALARHERASARKQ